MALTIAKILVSLEKLKCERAIWIEVIDHLRVFVSDEVHKASKGIALEGRPVPEVAIKEFLDSVLKNVLEPLNEKIESIEDLPVEEKQGDKVEYRKEVPKEGGKSKEVVEGPSPSPDPGKRPVAPTKSKTVFSRNS